MGTKIWELAFHDLHFIFITFFKCELLTQDVVKIALVDRIKLLSIAYRSSVSLAQGQAGQLENGEMIEVPFFWSKTGTGPNISAQEARPRDQRGAPRQGKEAEIRLDHIKAFLKAFCSQLDILQDWSAEEAVREKPGDADSVHEGVESRVISGRHVPLGIHPAWSFKVTPNSWFYVSFPH